MQERKAHKIRILLKSTTSSTRVLQDVELGLNLLIA